MYRIIFSLDYEIHGNGEGDPYKLMIEPTYRLMDLLDEYGAKLTIFADVAEIIKFKEFYETTGHDKFHYEGIKRQLQSAIQRGHDVQLHIHSSYLKSKYLNGKWVQYWSEYNLANLDYDRIFSIINTCKEFLEEMIQEKNNEYKCFVFRAANWSMSPSNNIIKAIINNGIKIDTSVYKYGKQTGIVNYDYREAYSNIIPWYVNENDLCVEDKNGSLLEVPIYCENRYLISFVTPIRIFRMIRAKFHKHHIEKESSNTKLNLNENKKKPFIQKFTNLIKKKYPWKLDFNQASGRQLINASKRINAKYHNSQLDMPIVLIGHSKTFIKLNEITMKTFLKYLQKNNDEYSFSLFQDLHLENYKF